MNVRIITGIFALVGMVAVLGMGGQPPDTAGDPSGELPEGVEVLARGPVHEAYADPNEPQPGPPPVVNQKPPDPIDELPPDVKPEGDDVTWIPGYWAWDDENNEFLWVSGFWRDVPPGREWVPGHWQQVAEGWQWVSGFWAAETQQELTYVPPPPASLEEGPSTEAPQANMLYVPGSWVYQNRYFWRPGFWLPQRPGWCWVPARYVWTPGGCVFVDGFWDRPLHARGLLFSPLRFLRRGLLPNFVHRPRFCVQPDFLLSSLFVRSVNRKYYFGDYFDQGYARRGFVPWVDYRPWRNLPDTNFNYYRWRFGGQAWERNLRNLYVGRFRNQIPRPPRTLVQQNQVINRFTQNKIIKNRVNQDIDITNLQAVNVLAPIQKLDKTNVTALANLAGRKDIPGPIERLELNMRRLEKDQRGAARESAQRLREVGHKRQQAEAAIVRDGKGVRDGAPRKMKLDLPRRPAAEKDRPKRINVPPPVPRPGKLEQRPVPREDRPKVRDRDTRPKVKDRDDRPKVKIPDDRPKAKPKDKDRSPRPKVKDRDRDRPKVKDRDRDRPKVKDRDRDRPKIVVPDRERPKRIEPDRQPRRIEPDRPRRVEPNRVPRRQVQPDRERPRKAEPPRSRDLRQRPPDRKDRPPDRDRRDDRRPKRDKD